MNWYRNRDIWLGLQSWALFWPVSFFLYTSLGIAAKKLDIPFSLTLTLLFLGAGARVSQRFLAKCGKSRVFQQRPGSFHFWPKYFDSLRPSHSNRRMRIKGKRAYPIFFCTYSEGCVLRIERKSRVKRKGPGSAAMHLTLEKNTMKIQKFFVLKSMGN